MAIELTAERVELLRALDGHKARINKGKVWVDRKPFPTQDLYALRAAGFVAAEREFPARSDTVFYRTDAGSAYVAALTARSTDS